MNNMQAPGKPTQENPESYSVIIADDDRVTANLLSVNMCRLGHRIAGIAWNGREAVAMALKLSPDVVIMDIHMPGLDGIEAAVEILSARRISVILSTGHADNMTLRRAIDHHLFSYLVKPYGPNQLKVAVRLAVAEARRLANPRTGPGGLANPPAAFTA